MCSFCAAFEILDWNFKPNSLCSKWTPTQLLCWGNTIVHATTICPETSVVINYLSLFIRLLSRIISYPCSHCTSSSSSTEWQCATLMLFGFVEHSVPIDHWKVMWDLPRRLSHHFTPRASGPFCWFDFIWAYFYLKAVYWCRQIWFKMKGSDLSVVSNNGCLL